MPRPADVGHLLLSFIPIEPKSIDTTKLRALLDQQGIRRTPRAIQQTLRALAAEHPLHCIDKSKPFQWQWMKGAPAYEFPPMNAHQALTLKLAYAHLANLLPQTTLEHLKGQLRRADEVLASASPVASWGGKVRVLPRGVNLLPPKIDRAVLAGVYGALLADKRFEVTYRRRGEKDDETYDVNPIALVVRGSLLTLVCTLGKGKGTRQLHLHRMRRVAVLDRRASRPESFDLDAFIAGGNLSFPVGPSEVRLRARITPMVSQTLEETPLAADQRLRPEAEGRVLLEATVADTLELRGWLGSYGANVEVLEPADLRSALASQAREVAALYGPAGALSGAGDARSKA